MDEKFIDDAIAMFDELKNVYSVFFILTASNQKKLFHVKSPNVATFSSFEEILSIINCGNNDMVMIHSLFLPYHVVLKIQIPIIWSTWGFDIYSDESAPLKKLFSISLYKPKTKALLDGPPRNNLPGLTGRFFSLKSRIDNLREQRKYTRIAKNTSFFATVLPEEFEKIKQKFPTASYCPFHYFSEPLRFSKASRSTPFKANRILLGNSNDPTNNHYDILEKLNSLNTSLEIIIPFSYPFKDDEYSSRLPKEAENFKNLSIIFLKDFIERDKYFQLIDSCSTAIFGHIRQQAVGNITYCLMTGKKLFFYENSILFHHYRNLGYSIFSIENDLNKKTLEADLSSDDQENNKKKCSDEWNYKRQIEKLQLFFQNLEFSDK